MNAALSIDWAPYLPWSAIDALGALAGVAVALALWRRARGAGWRALVFGVMILALANPSLVEEERQALDDIAFVVVDESASQDIDPRPRQSEAALAGLLRALGGVPDTEVRVVRAGGDAAGLAKDGTRLFTALGKALSKVPRRRVGGIFVVSDGQVHDTPDNLEALDVDAPVHLLLTGTKNEGDRRLTIKRAPTFGIVDRAMAMTVVVEDLGQPEAGRDGRLARIVVRRDGQEDQRLMVPVGVEQEIPFTLDHRGPSVLEVEVEPGPRELTLVNNRAAIEVNGVRERLRVLLVSGEPHAGERAWRNILKSDPSVDLVHFTILRPPEKQDGTPIRELSLIAFPTRELFEIKLDEFDLIIFDRYRRRGVLPSLYLQNIADYVERGGALLEAVGPTFATPLSLYRTPLGRVLPGEPTGAVFEQGYRPRVTPLGERHPVTAELPGDANPNPTWGRWFRQVDADAKSGAIVMSGVDDRPLLILDRVGKGRVAQILSDHIWLWARGFEGGGPQAELLRRIAHWLMREPDLEEESLRAHVSAGALNVTRRSLTPELPEIQVITPSGARRTLRLEPDKAGRAVGSMTPDEPGLYRVSDGRQTALAAVGPINPREFRDVRSSAEILGPLVEASGGAVVRLAETPTPRVRKVAPTRDRHGRGWLGVVANGGYVVTGASQAPLLPPLVLLVLVLGGAVLAWYREGR